MGGAILGSGSFNGTTSWDENSQLCALGNNFRSIIELFSSQDIQEEACAGPGRELDRCIEIITPSAWCLVPVSSFPSCETPDGQASFAQHRLRSLSSIMMLIVSSKATASKSEALEPYVSLSSRGS